MLRWSLIFFVVALAAAFFGFGGISSSMSEIAKILFFLFVIGLVISLLMNFLGSGKRRRSPF